jgi:RNA polymerase sigma factor (TIGR02999 family)
MPEPGPNSNAGDVTLLLRQLQRGDQKTLTPLIELVYPELRKLARGLLRQEHRSHVLQATALVNEAYMRLVAHEHHTWKNRAHFFGASAHIMRRILVDHARASCAMKRSGGRTIVDLKDVELTTEGRSLDIIALDHALGELEDVSPRQARIVELRFFCGLSVAETAEALGANPRTVDRDWAAARVWLRRRLKP